MNTSGYMHFWDLTIDVVTTIQLIIAIGLTVDYSAHIAHAFMSSRKGTRQGNTALPPLFASSYSIISIKKGRSPIFEKINSRSKIRQNGPKMAQI